MGDIQVQGANRVPEERRVRHLVAPLPKVQGALLAVAQRYEDRYEGDEVGRTVAEALRAVAEELHYWF